MMLQQKQLCVSPSVTIAPFMMSFSYPEVTTAGFYGVRLQRGPGELAFYPCSVSAILPHTSLYEPTAVFPTDINHSPGPLCKS